MNVAYNMDCMDYMRDHPDKSIDLTVADPRYYSDLSDAGTYGKKEILLLCAVWFIQNGKMRLYQEPGCVSGNRAGFKRYIVFGCNYFQHIFCAQHGSCG